MFFEVNENFIIINLYYHQTLVGLLLNLKLSTESS